jgi:hypothetical protein
MTRVAEQPSDWEGRRPSRVWLERVGGENVAARGRADRLRFAFKPTGQGRQVWLDKRYSLSGEPAKRALIAAMAGWVMLDGRLVVVALDAELSGVSKERLEFSGDRRIISAGEGRRGKSRRRGGGEKLNDERKRNDKFG